MKKKMKKVRIIALLFIILCLALSMTSCAKFRVNDIFSCSIIDYNIENYAETVANVKFANEFMPELSELSGYTDISYSHLQTHIGITFFLLMFEANGIALWVEYPDDIYEQKKEEVLTSYDFIEKETYDGEHLITPLANFEYNGYDFRADVNEEYRSCRSFALIGCNDEANRIVYCYYFDPDNDYIANSQLTVALEMNAFINSYFEWNDIK